MRRILVIFLILLFPLNAMALSMSVSMAQHDGASAHASVASVDAFQGDTNPDIDPDEPPASAELHDFMNQDRCLQLAAAGAAAVAPPAAAPCCLSLPPPDKPPRRA